MPITSGRRWTVNGRRGWGLVALGVGALVRGGLYLPAARPSRLPSGLDDISIVIPITAWAIIWMLVGAACLVGSTRGGWRCIAPYALPALGALMTIWGGAYLVGFLRDPWTPTMDPLLLPGTLVLNRDLLTVFTYGSPGLALLLWAPLIVRGEAPGRAD